MRIRTKIIWASLFMLAVPPVSCVKVFCDLVGGDGELCESQAVAGENPRIELVIGQSAVDGEGVNGTEIDTDADAYAGRFLQDFGESGYFAGGVQLERVELADVDGGAWCVDAVARIQRNKGHLRWFAGGALGGIFTDVESVPAPVEVSTGEGTLEGEAMTAVQNVGLRASGIVGAQLYFDDSQRVGVGVEYAYSKPLGDGFVLDEDRGGRIFLILPASAAPATVTP